MYQQQNKFPQNYYSTSQKYNPKTKNFPTHFNHQTNITTFQISKHPQNLHNYTPNLNPIQHTTNTKILLPTNTYTHIQLHIQNISYINYLTIILKYTSTQPFLTILIHKKLTQ